MDHGAISRAPGSDFARNPRRALYSRRGLCGRFSVSEISDGGDFRDLAVIDWESQTESTILRDWLFEFLDLIPVVILCSEPDSGIFKRILHSRAGGMILQTDISSEQIVQAIKSVAAGFLVFDSALMPQRSEDDPLAEPLTPREGEVLRLLAEGSGNKEIAARLNISEHTIKFHIRSILGKLGAASRTEAVTRGLRSGLIDL